MQADPQPNPVLHGLNMKTNFLVTESHSLFYHYEPSLASFGLPSFQVGIGDNDSIAGLDLYLRFGGWIKTILIDLERWIGHFFYLLFKIQGNYKVLLENCILDVCQFLAELLMEVGETVNHILEPSLYFNLFQLLIQSHHT